MTISTPAALNMRGQFETLAVLFGTVSCSGYPMVCDTAQLCQARALQLIQSGKVPNL